jgi:metal-responsive CopG/Arc/MetJ family transcriptional regulator
MAQGSTKKAEPVVSVRLSSETLRQLEELREEWGENRSQAIARAVQIAYDVTFPPEVLDDD